MLFLHSIKTFNFKSYKDLHLIGPFDRKFTAIVGPNGCGKSNVIDAILFVLGYNAKKMRHSALKDLVYKGESEMYVEIKFEIQNEETQNISNKHEALFLKRSFSFLNEKNSSSKYFIDNKNITHSEYLNILKRHNLNTNRFLILQGEIESISLMDSLQLLEYLESCIGTLELKELIETQTEKLKMLEKEFFIKEDDFTLEENTFKNMLRKFMSFHKSMEEKKNEINKKIKVLNKEQSNANSKLTKENDRLVQLKEEQNQIVAEKENLSKNVKKPHKPTELTETEDLFLKLQKEKEDIEIDYEVVNRKCEKLQLRTREEKDKYLHLEEKSKEDLVDLCNEKQDKINALYRKIEVFKEKNKEVYQEIEKYEKIIFDLNKKDEKYKNYVETKSILEKYKIEINALYKANNLKKEGLEEEFLSLQNKKKILEKNIFELRQKINEFSFYKKEEETALNNNKKDFKDNFMHMDGFVDVFYNMLEIEEGYEKAVCASTSHLCSIIVETTKDAEEMIKIINQKNLPRTTFVILDKIVAKNGSGINYNNCKKVIDCVKIKGEYKKYSKILSLFDYNTFITENLTEGRQLAYNSGTRKRVVTKQGVLLDKSGIMSNLGNNFNFLLGKNNGKHFIKVKKEYEENLNMLKIYNNENEELSKKIEIYKELIDKESVYKNMIKNLPNEEENFEDHKHFKSLQNDIERYRHMIENLTQNNNLEELNKDINSIRTAIKHLNSEKNEILFYMENILDNKKKHKEELKKVLSTKNQMDVKKQEILSKYTEYNILCNDLKEKYNEKIKEYNKNTIKIENLIKKEVKNKTEISTCNEKIKSLENLIFDYKKEISSLEAKEMVFEKYLTRIENEMKNIEIENNLIVSEVSHDLEDFSESNIIELVDAFVSIKATYDNKRNEINYLNDQIKKHKKELCDLKNERQHIFISALDTINTHLKRIFSSLTITGSAEIDLVNQLDVFGEGVILNVLKKTWKSIVNLSGGEKTLSSLSLIFALHSYNPSSFYVMDEIDAALDFKNVSLISQYIQRINAQFIVISLRNDMFEMAKTMVGVYKIHDKSEIVHYKI